MWNEEQAEQAERDAAEAAAYDQWLANVHHHAELRGALSLFDDDDPRLRACYDADHDPYDVVDGFVEDACRAASLHRVAPLW